MKERTKPRVVSNPGVEVASPCLRPDEVVWVDRESSRKTQESLIKHPVDEIGKS